MATLRDKGAYKSRAVLGANGRRQGDDWLPPPASTLPVLDAAVRCC